MAWAVQVASSPSGYAFTFREIDGKDPIITVIDLVKTKTPKLLELKTTRKVEKDLRFCEMAMEVAKGVNCGVFPPNPGWMCGDCEYKQMCREVGVETGVEERASAPF